MDGYRIHSFIFIFSICIRLNIRSNKCSTTVYHYIDPLYPNTEIEPLLCHMNIHESTNIKILKYDYYIPISGILTSSISYNNTYLGSDTGTVIGNKESYFKDHHSKWLGKMSKHNREF